MQTPVSTSRCFRAALIGLAALALGAAPAVAATPHRHGAKPTKKKPAAKRTVAVGPKGTRTAIAGTKSVPFRKRGKMSRAAVDRLAITDAMQALEPGARADSFVTSDRTPVSATFSYAEQKIGGLPVFGAQVVIEHDQAGNVVSVSGDASQATKLPAGSLSAADALAKAKPGAYLRTSEKVAYDPSVYGKSGAVVPAWHLTIAPVDGPDDDVIISAVDGRLLWATQTQQDLNRQVCEGGWGHMITLFIWIQMNNNCTAKVPDSEPLKQLGVWPTWTPQIARSEGQPESDSAQVNTVYNELGVADDYLWKRFGRGMSTDANTPLVATANVYLACWDGPCRLANAYWNRTTNEFTIGRDMAADDVVAHEYMHGVTGAIAGLTGGGQTGGLNESLSDMFGETIDRGFDSGGDDSPAARWLMGEDTFTGAARSMADPGKSTGSAFFVAGPDRLSSPLTSAGLKPQAMAGIGNKWFSLAAEGGTFNRMQVDGIGLDRVFKVVFTALPYLTPSADYEYFGWAVNHACANLQQVSQMTSFECWNIQKASAATEIWGTPPAASRGTLPARG